MPFIKEIRYWLIVGSFTKSLTQWWILTIVDLCNCVYVHVKKRHYSLSYSQYDEMLLCRYFASYLTLSRIMLCCRAYVPINIKTWQKWRENIDRSPCDTVRTQHPFVVLSPYSRVLLTALYGGFSPLQCRFVIVSCYCCVVLLGVPKRVRHGQINNYIVFPSCPHSAPSEQQPDMAYISHHGDLYYSGEQKWISGIPLHVLLPQTPQYITYEGSLTQPQCQETVTWVIFNKPIYITEYQVSSISPFTRHDNKYFTWTCSDILSIFLLKLKPIFHTRLFDILHTLN